MVSIEVTFAPPLQTVHWTFDALAAPVQDMDVNHRSFDVLVTEKFLNGPDAVAALQELRGEVMTKHVAGGPFGQAGSFHRAVDRLLDDRFVNVIRSAP